MEQGSRELLDVIRSKPVKEKKMTPHDLVKPNKISQNLDGISIFRQPKKKKMLLSNHSLETEILHNVCYWGVRQSFFFFFNPPADGEK